MSGQSDVTEADDATSVDNVLAAVSDDIDAYMGDPLTDDRSFDPEAETISLNAPSYGAPEVLEALESLLSTWVTMGEKVAQFEDGFAEYLDAAGAMMVNSGSSANLVALRALQSDRHEAELAPGDEVIVPACTWSTSVAPIIDVGATPVLVDSDPETFALDIDAVSEAITDDTAAVMAVHLLGNPARMDALTELCADHDLVLIEDCCEAHGAAFDGQRVGTFGAYGTYSFFFSHHISTMEGGMVVSNDSERIEAAKPIRAHGWVRELDDREELADDHQDIDERFLFVDSGMNVRPTDIQGAFGIHQLERLEPFIEIRRDNAERLSTELAAYDDVLEFQHEQPNGRHTWYGYPLVVAADAPFSRAEMTDHFEANNIETRPIMGGNLAEQPAFEHLRERAGRLPVATGLHDRGFFFGNHHRMGDEHIDHIVDVVDEFVAEHTSR